MRAIKNTAINFGMVNIPVKIYSATQDNDVHLSQFHDGCPSNPGKIGGGVGYRKVCKCCDAELTSDQIVKGVLRDDKQIIVTDDDMAALEVDCGPEIDVLQFINADEVDAIALEGHYFVAPPTAANVQGYALLRTAMVDKGRVAIVKFVMRRSGGVGKAHLAVMRPYADKAMVIDTISWATEIREPAFPILDAPTALDPKLVAMAHGLVEAMTDTYDPHAHVDEYTAKLSAFIDTKAAGKPARKRAAAPAADSSLGDLVAKLEASTRTRKPAAKMPRPTTAARKPAARKKAVA